MKKHILTDISGPITDREPLTPPHQPLVQPDTLTLEKPGLASRYLVGIRTIEAWTAEGILPHQRRGLRHLFCAEACDRALVNWSRTNLASTPPTISARVPNKIIVGRASLPTKTERTVMLLVTPSENRRFATKAMLAERYGVCLRTITNWIALGVLIPTINIGRIVRFELDATDKALREYGYSSEKLPPQN